MLTKADRLAIQQLQTDEKGMKEIEKARKNKGKRSVGRPVSEEARQQYKGIKNEFDKKVLQDNLKENNKILKEAGLPELTWEELYGKEKKKKVNPDSIERSIELDCCDEELRVAVSDEGMEFASVLKTRFGKPTWHSKEGAALWILDSKCFVFGGKRFQVAKSSGDANHGHIHILWTSHLPDVVYYETTDSRWINHGATIFEKNDGCKKYKARRKGESFTEVSYFFPKELMKVPSKK